MSGVDDGPRLGRLYIADLDRIGEVPESGLGQAPVLSSPGVRVVPTCQLLRTLTEESLFTAFM